MSRTFDRERLLLPGISLHPFSGLSLVAGAVVAVLICDLGFHSVIGVRLWVRVLVWVHLGDSSQIRSSIVSKADMVVNRS